MWHLFFVGVVVVVAAVVVAVAAAVAVVHVLVGAITIVGWVCFAFFDICSLFPPVLLPLVRHGQSSANKHGNPGSYKSDKSQ